MNNILLITPPFTQLNTPYPATAYLKGFLNTKEISSYQIDLGIEVVLELFTKESLDKLFNIAFQNSKIESDNSQRIFSLKAEYLKTIESVISFLQGSNQTLARLICTGDFLPQASRFNQTNNLDWAFGTMGMQDKAKHLATLYLEDLSDFITECIDTNFGFSRYAERLGLSANSFDELYKHLKNNPTYIDNISLNILDKQLQELQPKIVAFSIPFPGNLYSAFRCGLFIKQNYPDIKIVTGGGFPTTELRSVSDVRIFEFVDYIILDDGELPLELILSGNDKLKRTFIKENNKVVYYNNSELIDYKQSELGVPDYSNLLLNKYISVIEIVNPMHSLWSDGRWNKLTMAHGCYWAKCTFCDGSLDYIKNYKPNTAILLVDRMEQIIAQTGETGFHFVDEAAPPSLMRDLALEIIKRNIVVTWWTNIRFEKSFTLDLCLILKESGCIAISGGLEVASDRLLKLINKGVTVQQVANVTNNLSQAGIMVHAYLMYGFPSQNIQETIDSLEMVRQMFELGLIQSGFWHQFALTAHSPIGLNSEQFDIIPNYNEITFANNDVQFSDKNGIDHSKFSYGLKKSLFNFMHGIGFDFPLQDWFDFKTPRTKVAPSFIKNSIETENDFSTKPKAKIIWLGGKPIVNTKTKSKKGNSWQVLQLTVHFKVDKVQISVDVDKGKWLVKILTQLATGEKTFFTYEELKADFEMQFIDFELFWYSKPMNKLKKLGLLVL